MSTINPVPGSVGTTAKMAGPIDSVVLTRADMSVNVSVEDLNVSFTSGVVSLCSDIVLRKSLLAGHWRV